MKTNLWLTVITIALVLNGVMTYTRVEGDECTPGIRKEHLDTTPGAFVDNTTIEIGTNGLQVADGGVTAAKIANLSPAVYTGGESVTLPNGLIQKSGYASCPSLTSGTVTFAAAFPNGIISVICTQKHTTVPAYSSAVDNVTVTGFTFYKQFQPAGVYWIAIGY